MSKEYGYTAQIQAMEISIKPKEMVDRRRTCNFSDSPGIMGASIIIFRQTELDIVV